MGRIKQVVIFEVDNGERHFQNGTFTFSNLYLLHNKIETVCNTLKILVSLIIPLCQSALQSSTLMKYFKSGQKLDNLISQYFEIISPVTETEEIKSAKKADRDFPTISGLALHLGFSSTQEMEAYELKGKYAEKIKRARLRVIADYEKKLHVTSSTGAIFALKSMGWNERSESKPIDDKAKHVVKVSIVTSGPTLASSEQDVIL